MTQMRKVVMEVFALSAVALVLGLYVYFGIFRSDVHTQQRREKSMQLFDVPGGAPHLEIRKIVVTADGETTTLEKKPGSSRWAITSPVTADADVLVVDALVSQLQKAKLKAVIDESPDAAALKKYGLDAPRFCVEATGHVGDSTHRLKLTGGIENTFDGSVFIQRNDEPTVYSVEGGVRFTTAKTTFELRDKTPFTFDEKTLKRLSVKSVNNSYVLERTQDKQWTVLKPQREPADAATVTAMLSAMSTERALEFPVDSPDTRRRFGFDSPLLDAVAERTDGTTQRLKLARPTGVDAGESLFGLWEDEHGSVVATLNASALHFDRNPSDLKDRALLRFPREAVVRMVFHTPEHADVVVQKAAADASADDWRVVAPVEGKAKVFRVTGALWLLSNAKTLAYGEERPKDWNRYGLGATSKAVILQGESGQELARLQVGKAVPQTPSAYYVRSSNKDQVLQSDGSRFHELPFALADVLDEQRPDGGP